MKKLLSLPPNLVDSFHDVTGLAPQEYFCTCDPVGHRLGSGGGTTWLLQQAFEHEGAGSPLQFNEWLAGERRILLHAGGQSRRLPAYDPSCKILSPVPVFRWERGQRLSQDLLSLQLPLYEQMMAKAPDHIHTMIVSGDVYIRATQPLQPIPDADVVCYGLWLDASVAKNHGVFVSERLTPTVLKQMLQKPSVEQLNELQHDHYYLTDIGIWMLSDRAVELLMKRSSAAEPRDPEATCSLKEYDLYGEFGLTLGTHPLIDDPELRQLSVAILPLPGGAFYHFGTSREMISSTLAIQNIVNDQREIMHHDRKPHPSIFVQNADTHIAFSAENTNVWVENSCIGPHWQLTHDNIVTGVPQNDWHIRLEPGQCIDIVPIGENDFCVRCYHIDDRFAGGVQQEERFPVVSREALKSLDNRGDIDSQHLPTLLETTGHPHAPSVFLSAEQISDRANLRRLFAQRRDFRRANWLPLAHNWRHSVFYQLDLDHAAREFAEFGLPMPDSLPQDAPLMTRIHDAMFRNDSNKAFELLRQGLTESVLAQRQQPHMSVYQDQIVWGRSPVRIDISGGWTDTPPYCLMEGGNVVNLAIELNGQQPIQTYIKPSKEPKIVLRSIDLGAREEIETYEQLAQFNKVGSPFSIPKAALSLAGFLPQFSAERFASLRQQLEAFGSGIELTLLSAIPRCSVP